MYCPICGRKYEKIYNLITHLRRHFIESVVSNTCPICGRKFHSRNGLFRHYLMTRNEPELHKLLAYLYAGKGRNTRKNLHEVFMEVITNEETKKLLHQKTLETLTH